MSKKVVKKSKSTKVASKSEVAAEKALQKVTKREPSGEAPTVVKAVKTKKRKVKTIKPRKLSVHDQTALPLGPSFLGERKLIGPGNYAYMAPANAGALPTPEGWITDYKKMVDYLSDQPKKDQLRIVQWFLKSAVYSGRLAGTLKNVYRYAVIPGKPPTMCIGLTPPNCGISTEEVLKLAKKLDIKPAKD